MRKHRILAGILAVALVLSLGGVNISAATGSPMTDAAEVPVPEGYCELDYLKLYAFLEMADADGVKNGTKLNENYDHLGYHQRGRRKHHHLAGGDNRRGRG